MKKEKLFHFNKLHKNHSKILCNMPLVKAFKIWYHTITERNKNILGG